MRLCISEQVACAVAWRQLYNCSGYNICRSSCPPPAVLLCCFPPPPLYIHHLRLCPHPPHVPAPYRRAYCRPFTHTHNNTNARALSVRPSPRPPPLCIHHLRLCPHPSHTCRHRNAAHTYILRTRTHIPPPSPSPHNTVVAVGAVVSCHVGALIINNARRRPCITLLYKGAVLSAPTKFGWL